MEKKFNKVIIGGTFDHLHLGHKEFIRFALLMSKKIVIGLTSDNYVESKKLDSGIETYFQRKKSLSNFIKEEKAAERVEIIKIDDVYGMTISKDIVVDALIVTHETLKGAQEVNLKRKELCLPFLEIVVSSSLGSEDGEIISSSRIRKGEIDRNGKLYINPLWLKGKLLLSPILRQALKKPLGKIIVNDNFGIFPESILITVGDVTTQNFNKLSLNQKISVIDFKVSRLKKFSKSSDLGFLGSETTVRIKNPAGEITPELFTAAVNAFLTKNRLILEVLGEDDLAVLPLILAAPLNAIIFYGQPEIGIVKLVVTEKAKKKVYDFVSKFNY